ncbi:hypothetical protein IMZ48_42955 [Candidatus Bathyarchaeota archaeon]|nr:hypothetical protein [Candidatus Bathyarchaeota archaeon]
MSSRLYDPRVVPRAPGQLSELSIPQPTTPLLSWTALTICRNVDVLVIGAGPTGLGAAKRLNQMVRHRGLSKL